MPARPAPACELRRLTCACAVCRVRSRAAQESTIHLVLRLRGGEDPPEDPEVEEEAAEEEAADEEAEEVAEEEAEAEVEEEAPAEEAA